MINQFDPLLKNPKKPLPLPNTRKIEGIQLKKPIDESYHSSVLQSDRNSSIRNIINTTYFNSENSFSRNSSLHSIPMSSSSRVLPHITEPQTGNDRAFGGKGNGSRGSEKWDGVRSVSTQKESPVRMHKKTEIQKQITIEELLKKYIDTNFVQSLISFTNKQWAQQEQILLRDKRFEALKNVIIQKTNQINNLIQDFMLMQYEKYSPKQRKMAVSFLFKIKSQVLKEYQSLFVQILKKIPQDKIVKQQTEIQQLYSKLLEIYDPKYLTSSQKMKQRVQLFMQGYTLKKNNLTASIVTKLKPYLDFINEMEKYLFLYQKELIRVRNQLQAAELEKNKVNGLLKKKANFTPVEIDFQRLREIKEESKKQFFEDLEGNFINFHQEQHKRNDKTIKNQSKQNQALKLQLQTQRQNLKTLQSQLQTIKNSVPKTQQTSTQVYLLTQKKSLEGTSISSTVLINFLQNVSTPFTFSQKITASLINLLSIDKILYDYEIVRNRGQLQCFGDFMITWFLVRTGSKKIAQIFTKNFMYSVKELKNRHKRFNIFAKICGFNGFRKKNIQQDLQYIFFQTQKSWYCLLKLALLYRKKLNQNPTGFHLFPPLPCQSIFKLPLRKIYELVQEFLTSEGFQIPTDLNNQIDYYAINEISKFKSHDEEFQKEQLQEIHILREINFDIIAGFVLEYIAREKCTVLEKLLRAITMKQKQVGDVLGYYQFEGVYRKFYKERRAKIQNIYSKICVINQHDMMDIENVEPIIRAILEDQSGMRGIFEEIQSLKVLILGQKEKLKTDKLVPNINSYENFRERYYYEFYDFYNTTFFLQDIFRIIRVLIKKKMKKFMKNQQELDKLIEEKEPLKLNDEQNKEDQKQKQKQAKKAQGQQESDDDQDQYSDQQPTKKQPQTKLANPNQKGDSSARKKNQLQTKIEQWNKIIIRIPHFGQKILTIDQIIVHNMRRKEMIEASQFAWRTLRDILVMISKQ